MNSFDWSNFNPSEEEYHLPDPNLCKLADTLLQLYQNESAIYQLARAAVKEKHAKFFYRAAEMCIAQNIAPELYVRQQIQGMATTGKLWPEAIASVKLQNKATTAAKLSALDLNKYKAMLAMWQHSCTVLGPSTAIHSDQLLFTPLFRVMIAAKFNIADVITPRMLDLASLEFERSLVAQELFPEFKQIYATNRG